MTPPEPGSLAELNEIELMGNARIILLTDMRRSVIVDAADYEWLSAYRWVFCGRRYAATYHWIDEAGKKGRAFMHRLLVGALPGEEGDHINGNGLDNRRCNLRRATVAQNQWNRPAPRNNTSGRKGVSFVQARDRPSKWLVQIVVNGRTIHLGWHMTFEQAVAVREAGEIKYHGEFRHGGL